MKVNKIALLAATLGILVSAQVYADDTMPKHPHMGPCMMDADTNKDGKISHDEFMAASQKRSEEMFKRMDTNGDGVIDQTERQAAFDKMHERRQQWRENHPKPDTPKPN